MKKISLVIVMFSLALLVTGCSNKGGVSFDSGTANKISKSEKNAIEEISEVNVVESSINGESVSLKSVHFKFDKFNVSNSMRPILKENYKYISNIESTNATVKIKLEGNCDEWGTDEYNYALGLKRAKTIKDSLVSDGISSDKIVLVSFGESNPVCTNKSEKCWKKNRRVDYKLLP